MIKKSNLNVFHLNERKDCIAVVEKKEERQNEKVSISIYVNSVFHVLNWM